MPITPGAARSAASPSAAAAARAVFAVFAASGFGFASWASRLPAVRDGLTFGEGEMGLLLLTGAIGSVVAIPLSGLVVERLGTSRTVVVFALTFTVGVAIAAFGVHNGDHLAVRAGLVVSGVGAGVWDAGMNLEGAAVEQRLGRAVMPVFHAGFSFGTVLGAGVGALAARFALPVEWHVPAAGVVALLTVVVSVRYFLPEQVPDAVRAPQAHPVAGTAAHPGSTADMQADPAATALITAPADPAAPGERPASGGEGGPKGTRGLLTAWREPRTLAVGLVVLGAALTEGVANDWVGLAIVDGFHVPDSVGALGLAVFLTAMTTARLLGTRAIDRFGRVVTLRVSAVLAIVGVGIFALVPSLWVALVGVGLWGAGAALGFPVGMSAASDDPARAAMRVAVASTIGYSAFFVGPPLIGFLADVTGYRLAVLVLALPVALGLVVAGAVRPLPTAAGSAR
ncbi:MFS transporter [Antribacter gilvus]|uniref:MFS transporter n=1 Tax=Antribacter gilvus TaxID=2304675 RepID=UPI001F0C3E5A|nr:MFS transporter [Antribacter gilvus]